MATKKITKPDRDDDSKREHKKLKTFLVLECLMQETDEEHPKSSYDIAEYIIEHYGIEAEHRSILNDIKELNYLLYMLENSFSENFLTITFPLSIGTQTLDRFQKVICISRFTSSVL